MVIGFIDRERQNMIRLVVGIGLWCIFILSQAHNYLPGMHVDFSRAAPPLNFKINHLRQVALSVLY